MLRSSARSSKARASVFAALGDETRLSMLAKLASGEPRSIARLTAGTSLTRQAVTKHLRVLESAGIVRGLRFGREHRFELETRAILDAQQYLQAVSVRWDDALARLKAAVESK